MHFNSNIIKKQRTIDLIENDFIFPINQFEIPNEAREVNNILGLLSALNHHNQMKILFPKRTYDFEVKLLNLENTLIIIIFLLK